METENIFLIYRILVAIFWLNLHQERQLQMKWKARENINIFFGTFQKGKQNYKSVYVKTSTLGTCNFLFLGNLF